MTAKDKQGPSDLFAETTEFYHKYEKLTLEPDEALPEQITPQGDARGRFLPGNQLAKNGYKGKTFIKSRESVKKMQQLGLDPIEQLVREYAYAEDPQIRVSILNTLIKYGYSPVPVQTETKIEGAIPVLNITKIASE